MIVSLNTGLNPRKFFKLNTEDATNYYITIREMKDGKIVPSEKTDRMNDEAQKLCNNRSNLEVGDVLFSGTGTIGETAVIEKEPSNWNMNCTPFVRQYGILFRKWGVFVCQRDNESTTERRR